MTQIIEAKITALTNDKARLIVTEVTVSGLDVEQTALDLQEIFHLRGHLVNITYIID